MSTTIKVLIGIGIFIALLIIGAMLPEVETEEEKMIKSLPIYDIVKNEYIGTGNFAKGKDIKVLIQSENWKEKDLINIAHLIAKDELKKDKGLTRAFIYFCIFECPEFGGQYQIELKDINAPKKDYELQHNTWQEELKNK